MATIAQKRFKNGKPSLFSKRRFYRFKTGQDAIGQYIGEGVERTRGNLLRKRESWSKRGPGFWSMAVTVAVMVVAEMV